MSVSGLVVVDKEAGWTSHDVVGRCRRIFGQRRVGHAGTGRVGLGIESVHGDRPRGALHLNALPGQLVQAAATDLDGRDHRRHLLDLPCEPFGGDPHQLRGHV